MASRFSPRNVARAFFSATAFSLSALSFIAPCAHAADLLDTVKHRGTLEIGLEGTYPPFGFKAPGGDLQGFDVDVATELARRLGVKPHFVTTEWSGIIAGLQAGKYDVIVNQVGITAARQKMLDFSTPYTYSIGQLIQRKNDDRQFRSLDDLKGHKLGVSLGSNYNDMAKAVPGIDVRTYPGAPEYLSDLAAGRIDAALNDRLMLAYLLKHSALPLRTSGTVGDPSEMGIPFRKDNPAFAKAVNNALADMRSDGTLTRLSDKWFGVDVSKPLTATAAK
ncbi:cystine ABC transporter substrate-binding protein [Robbsia andropogonis]|uniref:cystine ABC transporter substrate-binding protein n=1 Tax=Robbsia andropogonis TaxID=28092 RepID=UPI003D1A9343